MKDNFWKNKKVLVTGFAGFLGSHLTHALLYNQAKVWGLDIKTGRKQTILSDRELDEITAIKGSVESLSLLSKVIRNNNIEFIFHLAAEALVGRCLRKPLRAFSVNIKGTWNILEAGCKNKSIRAVVIASSDKAYGDQRKLPYKENFPLCGSHPYDVSKSCADLLSYAYFNTYNLPVCVTRCGNIFGPGDLNFSRIVPDAIRSALKDKRLAIRSDGKFIRDYIYVEDIVEGYLMLAKKMLKNNLAGESFNFSNENPLSVLEIVRLIYALIGKKPNYRILNKASYEIKKQYLSSHKAKDILGWRPRYRLSPALRKTIDWYQAYFAK